MPKSPILTLLFILSSAFIFGQNIKIDTLLNSGIKDNRINFAFANVDHASANSYESKDEFISDLQDLLQRFDPNSPLSKSGYSHYRNFFNVYSVWFQDPYIFEAIPQYYQESQATIDSLFLPWADDQHGWVTMMYSLKGGGGGGAGRRDDLRRGDALIWGLEWETILHEFNHTMPGVGDEYTASGEWSNFVCNESPNQTPALVKEDVPWRKWIDEDTPIPTAYAEEYFGKVGAFEGTIAGFFGCQRPTAQSCYMGAGGFGEGFGTDMCSVCLQRFICRTYQFVDAIEDESPPGNIVELHPDELTINFSVNIVKPIPNTQQYKWFLNEKCIAENVESVDITFGECEYYRVRFEMTDTTDFVRFDEKFATLYPEPKQSHDWWVYGITADYDLGANVTSINADCSGNNNGKLIVDAQGGIPPYSYLVDGKEYNSENNLSPGTHQLNVVDSYGCDITQEVEIGQDPFFECTTVSEFEDGVWKLYPVFSDDFEGDILSYVWSTGSIEPEIYTIEKGSYSLEVSSSVDCIVTREISLNETPCANLHVEHSIKNPTSNEDGAIYIDIQYGTEPYTIQWYKNEAKDLTVDNPDAVFSNGEHSIHPAYFLFDDRVDNSVDFWASGFTGENYAGYDFGQSTFVDYYSITSNVDVQGRDARDWIIQGSKDMNIWSDIDTKTDINFDSRLEKKEFFLPQGVEYRYYRILITKNHGDGWVAIQELEFGSTTSNRVEIKSSRNNPSLVDASPGTYNYVVTDQNGNRKANSAKLLNQSYLASSPIIVVQDGAETVKIDNPESTMNYYWFADPNASDLLHKGLTFQPPASGNYYVRAVAESTQSFASGIKGFAVTMQPAPEVTSDNGTFTILNPNQDAEYHWYNTQTGSQTIHIGTSYTAPEMGKYYVTMNLMVTNDTPIDPEEIGNITLWADASDIDGDYQMDEGLENSSAYKWKFRVNGGWDQNGWHAYRTNYSNGLGVVDLATVWFQYVENEAADVRSFIITYEENGFSREGSAPFYGLKRYMAKYEDQSQLFSDNIADVAKNSTVYINGQAVDPETTFNSYEMKSLSMVLDQDESISLFAIDEYWEGKIAEFIVFDKVLNDEELKGVHAYMRKKWLSTADLASPRTEVKWVDEDISFENSEEVFICYGHDYLGLTEEGTYIRVMKTTEGYDSIVTTTVIFEEPTEFPGIELQGTLVFTDLAAESYQWYYNGIAIEGANKSEYIVLKEGDYSLVVTLFDGCMVESNVITYLISSVGDPDHIKYRIYPNPASDYVTIENLTGRDLAYNISDSKGHKLRKGQIRSDILVIDISTFYSGVYILNITDSSNSVSRKLVKI